MSEPYTLPPKLDLSAASGLAADLRTRCTADLTLDATNVTQVGALGVQIIASAARSAQAAGHKVQLIHLSDKALEQLSHLGFTPETLTAPELEVTE
ncbi:STAS domain-containing protein [Pseudooceanicola sp. MF1-13]|uniref:STAS domain-containing protein n=1 Tax=Pseudooceanicola sp. MF1-13 TaxID=3379095 RepID=UPI003891D064